MFKLLIGLLGFTAGMGLGFIAKEEILLGKKYLQGLRYVLSLCILIVSEFYLIQYRQWILLSVSVLLWILLLILSWKWKSKITELFFYGLLVSFYFLLPASTLIASLIFLYGLPVGSLLWLGYTNKQK